MHQEISRKTTIIIVQGSVIKYGQRIGQKSMTEWSTPECLTKTITVTRAAATIYLIKLLQAYQTHF